MLAGRWLEAFNKHESVFRLKGGQSLSGRPTMHHFHSTCYVCGRNHDSNRPYFLYFPLPSNQQEEVSGLGPQQGLDS